MLWYPPDEGELLGLKNTIIERNRAHQRSLLSRRDAARRLAREGRTTDDALVELTSLDKTVAFYDDRLEFRSRIGTKHRVIPYRRIDAISLNEGFAVPTVVTTKETFAVTPATSKKMVMELKSRRRPQTFDFRHESIERINTAMAIVRQRLARATRDVDDRDVQAADPQRRTRAEELLTMTELHRGGVISDEEFEREKSRILDS